MTKEKSKMPFINRRYIYNFNYHLIWVTKYRNQTFTTEVLSNEMKAILQQVADDNDIVIEKMISHAGSHSYADQFSAKQSSG